MRHKKDNKRLGRPTAHREAMLTNLLQSLVKHGRITTTLVRAKELQRLADRIVTIAKRRSQAAYVQLTKYIKSERELLITKLMEEIAPKFADRKGGYTRVVKLGFRRGDAAPTAIIEYLSEVIVGKPVETETETPTDEKKEPKAKKPAAKKAPAKKEAAPKKEAKAKKEEKEPAKKKSAKKKEE